MSDDQALSQIHELRGQLNDLLAELVELSEKVDGLAEKLAALEIANENQAVNEVKPGTVLSW